MKVTIYILARWNAHKNKTFMSQPVRDVLQGNSGYRNNRNRYNENILNICDQFPNYHAKVTRKTHTKITKNQNDLDFFLFKSCVIMKLR